MKWSTRLLTLLCTEASSSVSVWPVGTADASAVRDVLGSVHLSRRVIDAGRVFWSGEAKVKASLGKSN